MNLAQIVQSHALSFFHLSAPDLLLGFDADPAGRNLFGLLGANPELARDGIAAAAVRPADHRVARAASASTRPGWCPGGVAAPLTAETRDQIRGRPARGAGRHPSGRSDWFKRLRCGASRRRPTVRQLPLAVHGPGRPRRHRRALRRRPAGRRRRRGRSLADGLDPRPYQEYIGEAVEPWSYLKSAYWKALGYPDGIYRVGPLARLNVGRPDGHPAGRRGAGASSGPGWAAPRPARSTTTTPG